MGKYNFDTIIDRKNTDCIKYDFKAERQMPSDVLPLWVADMDFETAPEIKEAMLARVYHGIFGYTKPKSDYRETIIEWMKKKHNWNTRPEWYFYTPGVVFAISMTLQALTKEGDRVIIQNPVYYPFTNVVVENQRNLIVNPLQHHKDLDGNIKYTMDLVDFEEKVKKYQVKVFIMSNPHNPVGRVWTTEELEAVGDICIRHGVKIISDEIHQDFIFEGYKHIPFAMIKPEFEANTITCTSPSKTFNLAGLQLSNIIVSDRDIRNRILTEIRKTGYDEPNVIGMIACQAAYQYGEEWLKELNQYLANNLDYVRRFIQERLPAIKLVEPEGTYLIWLDFSETGLTDEEINNKIVTDSKLWLDRGTMFGEEGMYFQRVNIAAPRSIIEQAMLALEKAF